ncbi:MAG: hypothetical protein KatS3mg076_0110 [Candidatus Binatia bacterium]|nr:MAG: hypothetical protein KatS3mg076_0110 [Candidatus Binatia bacterium]
MKRWAMCALVLVSLPGVFSRAARAAEVVAADGRVELLRAGEEEWRALAPGTKISGLDQVRSGEGKADRVRLLFEDGTVLLLAPGSWIRLDEETLAPGKSAVLVRLLAGAARVLRPSGEAPGSRFEVETPTALVSGEDFALRFDPTASRTEVVALSGRAEVAGVLGVLGRPVTLESGMETTVRQGAFPDSPKRAAPESLARWERETEFLASAADSPLARFVALEAVPASGPAPAECVGARELARRRRGLEREADVIDQPFREFSLTRPGFVPPGNVRVELE